MSKINKKDTRMTSTDMNTQLIDITVFSLLNALGIYIFFLILGWASIGEGR